MYSVTNLSGVCLQGLLRKQKSLIVKTSQCRKGADDSFICVWTRCSGTVLPLHVIVVGVHEGLSQPAINFISSLHNRRICYDVRITRIDADKMVSSYNVDFVSLYIPVPWAKFQPIERSISVIKASAVPVVEHPRHHECMIIHNGR